MTLRQMFARFIGISLCVQVLCVLITTATVITLDLRNANAVAHDELARVFREHKHEIAGNLMLGHQALVEYQLNRIAEREGIDVGLESAVYTRAARPEGRRYAKLDCPVIFADQPYGVLTLTKSISFQRSLTKLGLALGAGQIVIFLLGAFAFYFWARQSVLTPLESLATTGATKPEAVQSPRWVPDEIKDIARTLTELWGRREKDSKDLAVAQISKQVAHDIRSPLAALEMVVRYSPDMPEERRLLLQGAANRVRDIADNLLKTCMGDVGNSTPADEENLVLWPFIESIAAEKRCEYREHRGLVITTEVEPRSMAACAKVPRNELSRLLSNLINNAVEACGNAGTVLIRLSGANPTVVTVEDDGAGMPPSMVERLNASIAVNSTKTAGCGLGLRHAQALLRRIGGGLRVSSTVGTGTAVTLTLPRAESPLWLARELEVPDATHVHILDDDPSIHRIWDLRATAEGWPARGVALFHHTNFRTLEGALRKASSQRSVYLFDFDLKWALNGIQIADSLGVSANTYLVTSRYDDASVQRECERLGIRIIPKALASRLPLAAQEDNKMQTNASPSVFVVVVERAGGEVMEDCPARTVEDARRHALEVFKRDEGARKVTVLEKDTYAPLGSVQGGEGEWKPASAFPLRRMTWH